MSGALAWCLMGAAVLLSGPSGAAGTRTAGPGQAGAAVPLSAADLVSAAGSRRVGRTLSPRAVQMVGAFCVAIGALALGGPVVGGVVALGLAPLTAGLLGRLAERPARSRADASLALALDLAAVALRSGQTVASALVLSAPALTGPVAAEWRRVAGLLSLGADPDQAWVALAQDPALASVAVAARRSAASGARLARAFAQLAVDTRAGLRVAAVARANRAGVFAMAPLGLCFLPAFVCLGIVPTVVGIAGEVLRAVP